jgi:hypothetical protein
MDKTTWIFLLVFVGLILFKLQSGRRSQEEVSVMQKAVNDGCLFGEAEVNFRFTPTNQKDHKFRPCT